ncbi:hypothetical protein DENSPDRAFT_887104 [Dentipellis sp. KUC8613]|nr:hypothetical protein DENSPDRAFT_887104 [Dentipellis sp. KUC8613]
MCPIHPWLELTISRPLAPQRAPRSVTLPRALLGQSPFLVRSSLTPPLAPQYHLLHPPHLTRPPSVSRTPSASCTPSQCSRAHGTSRARVPATPSSPTPPPSAALPPPPPALPPPPHAPAGLACRCAARLSPFYVATRRAVSYSVAPCRALSTPRSICNPWGRLGPRSSIFTSCRLVPRRAVSCLAPSSRRRAAGTPSSCPSPHRRTRFAVASRALAASWACGYKTTRVWARRKQCSPRHLPVSRARCCCLAPSTDAVSRLSGAV